MKDSVHFCSVMVLPKIHNRAGNITAIENQVQAPFDVKRVYYLYDVPGGADRGGHAHKKLHQFIIAVSGSFDVLLDDSINKRIVHLDRPYIGLYILPGNWRELLNFSSGAICLVLASEVYDETDYIREYQDFKKFKLQ
jgi:hypothetical protein